MTKLYIKIIHRLQLLFLMCLIISLNPLLSADCATFNEHQNPNTNFNELLASLTDQEALEFNDRVAGNTTSTTIQRLMLAVAINLGIYAFVRFGPTIYNFLADVIQAIPEALSNTLHFIFETARESALRNFQNATPEERARMLNIARSILANRTPVPPVA